MTENDFEAMRERHALTPQGKHEALMFKVRNVLNTIFIVGAIAGVVCTLKYDYQLGVYIIIGSMILKFVESAIRLLKL